MSGVFDTLRLSKCGFAVLLIGGLVVSGLAGCSNQQVAEKPSADVKRSAVARSNVATPERLSYAALDRLRHRVVYDGRYIPLAYPNGDVPANMGVCTDTVIRSYRKLGIDLQRLVYEDMSQNFYSYPNLAKWGLDKPDPNIDHRRVPNLKAFFTRHGGRVPVTSNPTDYHAGDLVTWNLGGDQEHIGIVVNRQSTADPNRPLIVHNIGEGEKIEDVLFQMPISGHYRYFPGRGGANYASSQ
jgi:hypothetical protein